MFVRSATPLLPNNAFGMVVNQLQLRAPSFVTSTTALARMNMLVVVQAVAADMPAFPRFYPGTIAPGACAVSEMTLKAVLVSNGHQRIHNRPTVRRCRPCGGLWCKELCWFRLRPGRDNGSQDLYRQKPGWRSRMAVALVHVMARMLHRRAQCRLRQLPRSGPRVQELTEMVCLTPKYSHTAFQSLNFGPAKETGFNSRGIATGYCHQ